ncbi:hypothetical protein [Streptomyces sp. S.PB5]|uniref:hypothetical protein n=1 Tax=Streptomyces sp. S.PB5 TaxID=3020844 RepID=UPI0025B02179|nr:hypothetical protein [Streptomyces sp. S.PB5]MDN3025728.1 hypothetical protein [Streptomyces sp. S.PB5]
MIPPSAASLRERAARSFAVDPQKISVTQSSASGERSLSTAAQSETTRTVTSRRMTAGPGREKHRSYRGFTAVYSARTGQLLEACWGAMCRP